MSADDPQRAILPEERLAAHHRDLAGAARLRRWLLVWLILFWALTIQMIVPPAPRLVWNASASAPVGLYRVRPGAAPGRGDMVVAWMPGAFRHLAATRRYVPENVPLVKRVSGIAGDRICAGGMAVTVNGRRVAIRRARDGQHRPMPWWHGCRTLRAGEFFLLMKDAAASFDGRYFGITARADIIGKATLLWSR